MRLAARFERALALHQQGRSGSSRMICERILERQASHVGALHLLGIIAVQTGNPLKAVQMIGRALANDPDNAVAHFNIGLAYQELRQTDAALASYDRAIALNPNLAEAYSNRSVVLKDRHELHAALASSERAIAIRANYGEAYFNRGVVLYELKQLDVALQSYDRSLAISPGHAEAYFNKGIVLYELNRWEAALASYAQAIALNSNYCAAFINYGNLLKEMGRTDAALVAYNRALALKPNSVGAHFNRSMLLLLMGCYEAGWPEFEWRWRNDQRAGSGLEKRSLPQPLWLGSESLAGRTILLHSEQGLGDTVQFCRYAILLVQLGATVLLEVQAPLVKLLGGLEGPARVLAAGDALPPFDYHCPLMSLPLALGTTLPTIPAQVPYLKIASQKLIHWRELLGESTKLRVGLVWSGGFRPGQPELWAVNSRRNISLATLAVLKHPDIEFFSLQKGQPHDQDFSARSASGWDASELKDFTDILEDFSDTAALMEQLDLIISVDTSVVHVAGALAKPVWVLNRFDTCWRWLLDRSDSPWYPSVKIYRQRKPGDWVGVVDRLKRDLWQLVS